MGADQSVKRCEIASDQLLEIERLYREASTRSDSFHKYLLKTKTKHYIRKVSSFSFRAFVGIKRSDDLSEQVRFIYLLFVLTDVKGCIFHPLDKL